MFLPRAFAVFVLYACSLVVAETAPEFSWQRNHADVTETGDLRWTPEPFRFSVGKSIRYIDFESGSDENDGLSKETAWKRHPWDPEARGNSAAANDVDTYLFKGGVVYRGRLMIKASGKSGAPIRLTRDPAWGNGPAILAGSEIVSNWTRGADNRKIPEGDKVWRAQLDFAPRTLWMIEPDGRSVRIPLARHPNWVSQPDDHKKDWFSWTNEKHPFKPREGFSANDSKNLKNLDVDFVLGARIYSEFGWVMGTPYPAPVTAFDPQDGSVNFENWTGGSPATVILRNMRYYLEDKPQYLDDDHGEFWFEKKGKTGMLYVRLPDGIDPNTVRLEAGKHPNLVTGSKAGHLEINGLEFRWTTQPWDLNSVKWDFSTMPFGIQEDATPACIRIFGEVNGVRIANCTFEDVVMGIRMSAQGQGAAVRGVTVEDNQFHRVDVGAAYLDDGVSWGFSHPVGELDDIRILRNWASDIGYRAPRYERGCVFDVEHVRRAEIAGNIIERSGAQGINVVGGKGTVRGDIPLIRVLIYQNKAWKTMQNGNDFGGIEAWQHGPIYIFNNLSFDARGQWEGARVFEGKSPGFGHAYYLDGGFKSYLFNNIAWGLSNDPTSPLVNCSAFQEILSFQNIFFNNTAYNFYVGSRRQAPHAGRNQFLGNVWQGMSEQVFRHSDPANTQADGNAEHAGPQKEKFALETNAYARNVFYDFGRLGVFEPSGRWLQSVEDFRTALRDQQSRVYELGTEDVVPTLRAPAEGDFRLNPKSLAVDRGAVTFVPWGLYGTVGEWQFYPTGNEPTMILDEHWRANDYLTHRDGFVNRPTYPLTAVRSEASDFIDGPLENFTRGALKFDRRRKSYATISDAQLKSPFTARLATRSEHGQDPQLQPFTFEGEALKTPEIYRGNFLVEVFFRAEGNGLLVQKRSDAGYAIGVREGRVKFEIQGDDGSVAKVTSNTKVADGKWHHLIVEADRNKKSLAIYVDGRMDQEAAGLANVSLSNSGDLFVGGTPEGDTLDGAIDFLRIAQGTLADAQTTIEELYAWQFHGPARHDMRGATAKGKGRDAGALESY